MHVYKHLNINSKFTSLKLRRRMIKRKEKHTLSIEMIVFGHTKYIYKHIVLQIMYSYACMVKSSDQKSVQYTQLNYISP